MVLRSGPEEWLFAGGSASGCQGLWQFTIMSFGLCNATAVIVVNECYLKRLQLLIILRIIWMRTASVV